MTAFTFSRAASALAIGAALALGLSGCGGPGDPDDVESGAPTSAATSTPDAQVTDDGTDGDFVGVTVPGTGNYAIGTDIPYGGFEFADGVLEQPDGCTWAIVDEDGVAVFENQGQIVFITDIPEAVTFITAGCPDWVQFE